MCRKDCDILTLDSVLVKTPGRDNECPRICDLLGDFTPRNVPEELRSHLHSDDSVKSLKNFPNVPLNFQ